MLGFLFGSLCLIGLVAVIARGRRWRRWGGRHGHGCGHGHGGWGGHAGGRRRGGPLFVLFERLDTTPGQEKAIREAVDEVVDVARGMKNELSQSVGDVARSLRGEAFDEALLGEAFARHDDRLRELQKAVAGALARIHDALDETQRKRLADLLEGGPFPRWGGPYRSWV